MLILRLLALIDIHTLVIVVLHDYLPIYYLLSGTSLSIFKGLVFFFPTRDLFSLIDILIGIMILFMAFLDIWGFLWLLVVIYLSYKIIMSFAAL